MSAAPAEARAIPVGIVKQFGPYGPEYEVLGPAAPQGGRQMVKILLVRTSEQVVYPLDAMLEDPEAQ